MTEAAPNPGSSPNAAAGAGAAQPAGTTPGQAPSPGPNGSPSPAAAAGAADAKFWDALPGLDAEDKKYLAGKNYADAKTWVKSSREADTKISSKGLIIPAEDAPKAEWDAFHAAQGRPEKAEAYEIALHDKDYQPTDTDKLLHGEMQKAAHEAGLTPKQWARLNNGFNGVFAKVQDNLKAMQAAHAEAGKKSIEAWEGEVKKRGGDPVKAKARAQTAAQTLIPQDSPLWQQLEPALEIKGQPGSGAAALIDLFDRVGAMMSESGGVLRPGGQAGHANLTAAQSQIELDRMKADPNIRQILNNPTHPQYKPTTDRWNGLIETVEKAAQAKRAQAP